ncbi:MAG: hypothetical protein JWN04_4188 [Myxococcaceae bacterium]|nr:hypothetical protein [Myxococcaceae bacterium]
MRHALAALALVLSTAVPSVAAARAVEDVTLSADPADIVLTVSSSEALHAPTVRTYPGAVRIRFYDARETPVLRLVGDGGAVRSVDVGSGSDQSAALFVLLGDKTRLAPTDIRVERDSQKVVFKIARGLLPAVREGSPMPMSAKPMVQPAKPVAPPAQAPVAAIVPPPVAPVAPVAAPVAGPAPAPAVAPKQAATGTLGAKKAPAKVEQKPELKLASGGSSAMPVLLSVSALLALAYGAMRLMMKKHIIASEIPAIDVVAQKRLGPRHQLVIVRAFDRDYLLSIQGGQTTVVARSSRKKLEAAEETLSPLSMLPMTASARYGSSASKRASAPAKGDFEDDEVTFGGELFKTALEQRDKVREQTAGFRLETARAEARAELARLDAAREEFSNTLEPTGLSGVEREREREEERITSEVPAGMSESVSGLLRLRKASGR